MEKYINLQENKSIKHMKYFTKPSDGKFSQFFSDVESTPKSNKNSRLMPLNQSVALKKGFYEPPTTPTSGSPRKFVKAGEHSLSNKFPIPPKTWLSAMDGELTPQDDKKKQHKSKFANSIIGVVEQSKNGSGTFSEHLTDLYPGPHSAKGNHRFNLSTDVSSQEQNEEEKIIPSFRSETRQKLQPNLSVPSYRIAKRKIVENGGVVGRTRPEETMSDNEYNKAVQNLKQDMHATLPYRHFIFGPQIDLDLFKKHLMMMHKGLVYATKNLKSPSEKFIRSKQISLPEQITKKTKTLLLDLDETLIHSCMLRDNPDVILSYNGSGMESPKQLPLKIRPHLKEFLSALSPLYEIVIFTASASAYAKTIINYIDKEKKHINAILSREHCMETKNGFYIKDLRIIKERDLKDMIIVDNLVHSFGFQIENGVPILEFINDKKDEELRHLKEYLLEAHKHDDLRAFNKKVLKLHDFANKNIDEIFHKLGGF